MQTFRLRNANGANPVGEKERMRRGGIPMYLTMGRYSVAFKRPIYLSRDRRRGRNRQLAEQGALLDSGLKT